MRGIIVHGPEAPLIQGSWVPLQMREWQFEGRESAVKQPTAASKSTSTNQHAVGGALPTHGAMCNEVKTLCLSNSEAQDNTRPHAM
jgi:hypothetical protein